MKTKPFRLPEELVTLTFEGTEYDGLEVVCRKAASINAFLGYQWLGNDPEFDEVAATLRRFGDEQLRAWNLVDEKSVPLPANGEELLGLPAMGLAAQIMGKWIERATQPAAPLETRSNDGELSAVGLTSSAA